MCSSDAALGMLSTLLPFRASLIQLPPPHSTAIACLKELPLPASFQGEEEPSLETHSAHSKAEEG